MAVARITGKRGTNSRLGPHDRFGGRSKWPVRPRQLAGRRLPKKCVDPPNLTITPLTVMLHTLLRGYAAIEDNFADMIQALNMFIRRPGIRCYGAHPVIGLTDNVKVPGRIVRRDTQCTGRGVS